MSAPPAPNRQGVSEPWSKPKLRGTWEVTHIADRSAFMRFVFASAPRGSQWVVELGWEASSIFDRLARIGTVVEKRWLGLLTIRRYVAVAITAETQGELGTLLASINVGALMEHHVYRDEELVMCSYDGLSCCWLGKSINHEVLKDASRTQGFHFTDTEDV